MFAQLFDAQIREVRHAHELRADGRRGEEEDIEGERAPPAHSRSIEQVLEFQCGPSPGPSRLFDDSSLSGWLGGVYG